MQKPWPRVLVVVATAAMAGFVVWLFLRDSSADKTAPERSRHPLTALPPAKVAVPGSLPSTPEFGTAAFKKSVLERCAKWVESRNRDAGSLIAMWDLTGDESLLDEAAAKFPNNPRVCVAMIQHMFTENVWMRENAAASQWVERLIAAEPENPAGWYWKARLSAKNPEAALEALRAATGIKGGPDLHLRERMTTVREATLASGFTVKEAAIAAYNAPGSRDAHVPAFAGSLGPLLSNEIAAAEKAGNSERVAEIASLGAAVAEHLKLNSAPSMMDNLVRITTLQAMLKKLDPATEFGDDGKTVGTRLSEVNAEKDEFLGASSQVWKDAGGETFSNLTENQASEFVDRMILHGDAAAIRWLKTQNFATPATDGAASQKK